MANGSIPPPPEGFTLDPPVSSVPPELSRAVISVESGGNPNAVSPKGALGLMQVMPATGAMYGANPHQLLDPNINPEIGNAYLGDLLKKYNGDQFKALVAYHSGPHRVDSGVFLPESVQYAKHVLGRIGGSVEGTAEASEIPPPPPGYTIDTPGRDVSEPSEVPGRLAGAPAALGGWIKEHPVEAALTAAGPVIGPAGEAIGLGEAATGVAPLVRTAAQVGIGAGAAALAGQPVSQGAATGLEYGALGELPAPIGRAVSGLGKATKAATQVMREPEADKLAQKALENELGVTTGKAESLAAPTSISPEGAQELAAGKRALLGAGHGAIREVGQKYEPIYGPLENQPVAPDDLTKVGTASKEASDFLFRKGIQTAPSVNKLLGKMQSYAAGSPVEAMAKGGGTFKLTNEQLAQLRAQGGPVLGVPPPTVGQLRGHLSEIMAEARKPGIGGIERRALMDASKPIINTLDNLIPDEQKPLLKQINDEYSQVNRIFPFKSQKPIQDASTLPQLGETAFAKGNTAATSMAVARMDEPQKQLMRKAFGSYVLNESDSPTQTLSKLQANKDTVKVLYPDSKSGNIETWRQMMIGQKRMAQGPPGLPSQREFEAGLRETIQRSGLTPEALQAASDALHKSGMLAPGTSTPRGIGRYLLVTAPVMSLMGWGLYHHEPGLMIPAVGYYAGMLGWRAVADNPAALDVYRDFIMSGWKRQGGDAFGRLFVSAANDVLRHSGQPEQQAVGHMKDMSEGTDALDKSRAEALAPTPSASKRAEKVGKDLEKTKKPTDVHQDLNRGRLSLDETNKMIQHASSTKAEKVVAPPIPLSEVIDALEVASPQELEILLPLVMKRMQQELPQEKNMTRQANLSKRFQAVQRKSQQPMPPMSQEQPPSQTAQEQTA